MRKKKKYMTNWQFWDDFGEGKFAVLLMTTILGWHNAKATVESAMSGRSNPIPKRPEPEKLYRAVVAELDWLPARYEKSTGKVLTPEIIWNTYRHLEDEMAEDLDDLNRQVAAGAAHAH